MPEAPALAGTACRRLPPTPLPSHHRAYLSVHWLAASAAAAPCIKLPQPFLTVYVPGSPTSMCTFPILSCSRLTHAPCTACPICHPPLAAYWGFEGTISSRLILPSSVLPMHALPSVHIHPNERPWFSTHHPCPFKSSVISSVASSVGPHLQPRLSPGLSSHQLCHLLPPASRNCLPRTLVFLP